MSVAPQSADQLGHFGAIIISKLKTLNYKDCLYLLVSITERNANAYNERYSDGNMKPETTADIIASLDSYLFSDNLEAQNIGLFAYNMDNAPQNILDQVQSLEDQAQGWIDQQTHTPPKIDTSGVQCAVLSRADIGNCSNNGISSQFDEVILSFSDNPPETINGTPVVKLVKRDIDGEYLHAEPVIRPDKGHVGYMMGGCYIVAQTSIGFPSKYPIPLHDRSESTEQYAANSN